MIMTEQAILEEIHSLPENLRLEVMHYVSFLKNKYLNGSDQPIQKKRVFGMAKGKFEMSDDFDDPLDDFKDYM